MALMVANQITVMANVTHCPPLLVVPLTECAHYSYETLFYDVNDFQSDNFCVKRIWHGTKYVLDNVHFKMFFSFQLQVEEFLKIRFTLELEQNLPSQTERIKMLLILTETGGLKRKSNLVKHCSWIRTRLKLYVVFPKKGANYSKKQTPNKTKTVPFIFAYIMQNIQIFSANNPVFFNNWKIIR